MPVTYTSYPVTVDGFRLDSAAWGITRKGRSTAPARPADVTMRGIDGVVASLNDDLDAMPLTYEMWLLGTDTDGLIPGGSNAMAQCRANLDTLTYLFGQKHRLMDVQEVVDASGTVRQYWCKGNDPITPEITPGGLGRFTVTLSVTSGLGQDTTTADWSATLPMTSGASVEVTTLAGLTGPMSDGIYLVGGPANNPRLTDPTTGAYVQLNATLSGSQFWRLNSDTWASRYGTSLGLGSSDATGTDGGPITVYGGGGKRFLTLRPTLQSGVRRALVSLSATGGMTSATSLAVRARRKFLI